jgi:tetratricopeptide (TPR) repeat protein
MQTAPLKWRLLGAALILVGTCAAFSPVLDAGFLEYDDDDYVFQNPHLRDTEGLRRIWLDPTATPQYYPLVHTTFWLEHSAWGLDPAGYHATNMVLHAGNAILLYLLLTNLCVPGAWLAAAVFALHPVHVESVAWITERKNTLSAFFYLASCLAFVRFYGLGGPARTLTGEERERRRAWATYAAGFLLFVLALLSKTVTVTLPVVLLIAIWWKRGRISPAEIASTAPVLVVGLGMALRTARLEVAHVGAWGPEWDLTLLDRALIAGRALWFYVGKLLWPTHLTFFYPRWTIDASVWWQYLFPATWILVAAGLWLSRERFGRGPVAALLFFTVTLSPALGFIDFFPMVYSFVADHFQYLASIGVIALAAASHAKFVGNRSAGVVARYGVPAMVLLTLAALTWRQAGHYETQELLTRQNVDANPQSWMGQLTMGVLLAEQGRNQEALRHVKASVDLKPGEAQTHRVLGNLLERLGRLDRAMKRYERALELDGSDAVSRQRLLYLRNEVAGSRER